jgi:single-strand DNA-binding protein
MTQTKSDVRVPDINEITIGGRVGKDPDLQYTQGQKAFCNFSVCNTKYGRDRDGNRTDENLWMNVTCWEKTAEFAAEHLRKGSPVIVKGRLREECWKDQQTGQDRKAMKLIAERLWPLAWSNAEDGEQEQRGRREPEGKSPYANEPEQEELPEDDIPF